MTQKELIDSCSEIPPSLCREGCPYRNKECAFYKAKYDTVPHMESELHPERYTDDVINIVEVAGEPKIDFGTEKKQCFDDYENGSLIMSDDKCGDCEHRYECRFMKEAMDEVVYGTD